MEVIECLLHNILPWRIVLYLHHKPALETTLRAYICVKIPYDESIYFSNVVDVENVTFNNLPH